MSSPPSGERTSERSTKKFAAFVQSFGVKDLASEIGVDFTSVYRWIKGTYPPSIQSAVAIVDVARRAGTKLTLEDIYANEVKAHTRNDEEHDAKNKVGLTA